MEGQKSQIQTLEMPLACIQRLIKNSFADDSEAVIVNKEAKQAFQQTAGLFALYIFSIANDISKECKRSKVTAEDIHRALKEVGFEKYSIDLAEFMANYD